MADDSLSDFMPGLQPVKGVPGIDFTLKSVDNEGKHDVDEIIKMGEKIPLNEHSHQHKPKLDGDLMGDNVAVGCAIEGCPIGWYIPITEAKRLGIMK
jgi:hypothetical protein